VETLNHKTKLASIGYTQGRLGLSPSAYYKKTKEERLKLRRKAYNLEIKSRKGTTKKRKTTRKKSQPKKSFLERLFDGC
tara:strand:+ start:708 stop:944 length:237 start_codon:yes stop_codon:yes gene_type:complete